MDYPRTPYTPFEPGQTPERAAASFNEIMQQRRSVREFSNRPVSKETIEWCVRTAGSAPSGAHKQPWRFVVIDDAAIKTQIREAAEAEEREFYRRRANAEWLKDLSPLETDPNKDFLEIAPWLIAVFKLARTDEGGQVYYANESIGIAVGMLLTAIHCAGLVTLTHTPSPMGFLRDILNRPDNERAYLLLPVGFAAEGCTVPKLQRKPLDEILVWNRGE
jgi:iodotyrosine deiodinase